jgi:hypothetical protein
VTQQPTLFGYADTRTRQPALFDTDGPPALTATCELCGAHLERTPSGYQTCPHGCLPLRPIDGPRPVPLGAAVVRPAAPPATREWSEQARRIARKHVARDNWHGRRWRCECGACSRARLDGFTPRERIDR